jgi:hypothetical protein
MKPLRTAFGLEHVSDDLITACANRVKIRCSKVDLTIYRRRTGQAALEYAACEAIVGAFRDYYPDRAHKFHIGSHWPHAHAVIRGNTAWIEISIGIDFEDPDEGLEVIEIPVDRHPKQISIREKIEDVLFNREARKTAKQAPPLELVTKAPTKLKEPAPVGKPIDPPKVAATAPKPPPKPAPSKPTPVRR